MRVRLFCGSKRGGYAPASLSILVIHVEEIVNRKDDLLGLNKYGKRRIVFSGVKNLFPATGLGER